jgi:hypothetical protein
MVAKAVSRSPALLGAGAALAAVGILAAMVVSGHLRESKQFVRFVPAGVMPEAPAEIDRLEIRTSARRISFVRAADGWREAFDGRPVAASLGAHLDDSIKFLHVSAPIRVMEQTEWEPSGLQEFGLDPPRYTAILTRRGTVVLGVEFGAPNPEGVLQYMRLAGRNEIYLVSRFIGEEWEKALREAAGE